MAEGKTIKIVLCRNAMHEQHTRLYKLFSTRHSTGKAQLRDAYESNREVRLASGGYNRPTSSCAYCDQVPSCGDYRFPILCKYLAMAATSRKHSGLLGNLAQFTRNGLFPYLICFQNWCFLFRK